MRGTDKVDTFVILIAMAFVTLVALDGCVTRNYRLKPDMLTSSNYIENIEVKKEDRTYYFAEYTDNKEKCFPPIELGLCSVRSLYREVGKADVEGFQIITTLTTSIRSTQTKELMYLVASDLSLQRGYPYFTVVDDYNSSVCGKSYSTTTYGTIFYNTYSGNTRLIVDVVCGATFSISIILYKSQSDLSKGLFYISRSISKYPNLKGLYPETRLYFGTMPGLDHTNYNYIRNSDYGEHYSTIRRDTPRNAWKSGYDAAGLSEELREKYKVSEHRAISFVDEAEVKAVPQQSPLDKHRHTRP